MKERHREWLKLSATPKAKLAVVERPVVRFRELPGIDDLERRCFLLTDHRGNMPAELDFEAQRLSLAIFGLGLKEPAYTFPDAYYECDEGSAEEWAFLRERGDFNSRFEVNHFPDPEKINHLLKLGWDFRAANGDPLRTLRLFAHQAEAVGKGIAGKWPDVRAAQEAKAESRLAEEARVWTQKHRRDVGH